MDFSKTTAYDLVNDWEFYKKAKVPQLGLSLAEVIHRHQLYHKLNEDASYIKGCLMSTDNNNLDQKMVEFQRDLSQYKDYAVIRILQK